MFVQLSTPKNMPGNKNITVSSCIEIEKFIFGVAMADANATPNMNFFHLKAML